MQNFDKNSNKVTVTINNITFTYSKLTWHLAWWLVFCFGILFGTMVCHFAEII